MSNFEKERRTLEERRQIASKKKEKQTDFYHALAKICFTALVVGVIVSVMQNPDSMGVLHVLVLILGLLTTYILYLYGNNKLK